MEAQKKLYLHSVLLRPLQKYHLLFVYLLMTLGPALMLLSLLERGLIDAIVSRKELKQQLSVYLEFSHRRTTASRGAE